ncbi:MAG: Hsp20/alpha crystallin family protein [Deferrisomatales bacterium]
MNTIEKTVPQTPEAAQPAEETTRARARFATPPVDIYETDDALVVIADLPGIRPDRLSVEVEHGVLTIEGRTDGEEPADWLWREFEPLSFFRQFRIAETIDKEKISAKLAHGVLTLTLPKAEEVRPRRIEVQTSEVPT